MHSGQITAITKHSHFREITNLRTYREVEGKAVCNFYRQAQVKIKQKPYFELKATCQEIASWIIWPLATNKTLLLPECLDHLEGVQLSLLCIQSWPANNDV